MKKLVLIISLFSFFLSNAQPVPDCAKNSASTRLFLKGSDQLFCDLGHAIPSYINECFAIYPYQIKDKRSINYFKINVYKNINDFSDDSWNRKKEAKMNVLKSVNDSSNGKKAIKMEIYFVNIIKKDSFNFYLEIPEFKEGAYFIDVSKIKKIKKVECPMCIDSIDATDITPDKWELENRKKWRKLKCK
jgi:hypothetical protein